jgi:hypothetical protein
VVKKYKRKSQATTKANQESTQILNANTPITGVNAKSSPINAPFKAQATKASVLVDEKQIFGDLKWSALVAGFIFILIVILYFTLR